MSRSQPRFEGLPDDDRLWLLAWLGPFDLHPNMNSQRTVYGFIQPFRDSERLPLSAVLNRTYPHNPKVFGNLKLVQFAVGELPLLSLGTFFRRRRALLPRRSLLEAVTFTLDFGRQSVFRFNDPHAPLGLDSLVLRGAWPMVGPSACTAFSWQDDPFGVCVPVVELLRWCYGSSSRMLQSILSRELESVLDWVDTHSVRRGNYVDLTLPPGFPEQDAHTLAWLSQDARARQHALRVDLSLTVSRQSSEHTPPFSYPAALFPYTGTRRVRALGRWLPIPEQPGRRRFLVHQILKIDFRLPFEVTLPRTQHGDQDDHQGTQGRRLPPARPQHTTLVSDQEPRRAGEARLLTALPSQFSGAQVLTRESDAQPLPRPTSFTATAAPVGPLSTGLGTDVHSQARQVTITREKNAPVLEPSAPRDDFATLERVVALLRKAGFEARELVIAVPERHGRFLVIHMQQQTRHAYLIEKARRPGAYGPLLIAAREGLGTGGATDLLPLITTREGRRAWLSTREGWTLLTVPHAYTDDARFALGIRKRVEGLEGWIRTRPAS